MNGRSGAFSWFGRRGLVIVTGVLIALAGPGVWLVLRPSHRSLLFWLCWGAPVAGGLLSFLGALLREGRLLRSVQLLVMNACVLGGLLGFGEAAFRLAHFDFDTMTGRSEDPREAYPVCFRIPEQPFGEVFFKRPGALEWTGRPLATALKLRHGTDRAYEDEQPFTSRYDADGFRNTAALTDWDIVVAGDSFTEAGYLPLDDIFTSVAARQSGLRIRNLGVCNTGPFTHVRYLRQFGGSPSCKHAVLAFYDGNDVLDGEEEMMNLEKNRATGWRPSREMKPQSSLLKACYTVAKRIVAVSPARRYQDAWLTAGGKETPISMRPSPMPVDPETMSARQRQALERALDEWAAATRDLKLTPWLMYLPSNNRTYQGLVRFADNASSECRNWRPGSLPALMKDLCKARGIHFIDACQVLRAAAEKGVLVYNPVYDTHLNREGSRLVGELLAGQLRAAR
ncbi:MAG: hypothetical protein K1X78_07000 [Verrucomicrobiaceae bacterium]|nr:hypothetical protein [Verrucomicrobiaceae bacterium]